MSITIQVAIAAEDYEAFGSLCGDYIQWCRQRYQSVPWLTDEVFGHQAINEELKGLSLKYGPPKGKTLLVRRDGEIVAGGAYRGLSRHHRLNSSSPANQETLPMLYFNSANPPIQGLVHG